MKVPKKTTARRRSSSSASDDPDGGPRTTSKSSKGSSSTVRQPTRTLTKKKREKPERAPTLAEDLAAATERWRAQDERTARKEGRRLPKEWSEGSLHEPDDLSRQPIGDELPSADAQAGTQRMVPTAVDLMDVKALQDLRPEIYGKMSPNQVWALVAGERKGQLLAARDDAKAAARLLELNDTFGTTYRAKHLPAILDALRNRRLATNYHLNQAPGAFLGGEGTTTLLDQLIGDPEGLFRNVWETGASQASTKLSSRGGVEEGFGYAFALKRVAGPPLVKDDANAFRTEDGTTKFDLQGLPDDAALDRAARRKITKQDERLLGDVADQRRRAAEYLDAMRQEMPSHLDPSEMPKYAAAVGESQPFGVAARYGSSVIYWKKQVDQRSTRTPGDSWSGVAHQGALSFVGAGYPATIFANTDEHVARLAAAEATDFEFDPELRQMRDRDGGVNLGQYIEAQIHGDLAWSDVEEIVLNWGTFPGKPGEPGPEITKVQARRTLQKLQSFAKDEGYSFTVKLGQKLVP